MNPQTNEVQYIGINWYVPLTFQDWDNDLPSKSERPHVGEYPANDPNPLGDALDYKYLWPSIHHYDGLCLGVGRVVDRVTRVQVDSYPGQHHD